MTRRRALDWVLIVALTASWAALFARGIAEGLRTGRGRLVVGVSSAPASDAYPTVLWKGTGEGLEVGDQLEAVEGESLRGGSALRFYDRATRVARERGFVSVQASRAGASFETRLGLTPSTGWWIRFPSSAALLLIALLLLIRAPGWHLARRNLVGLWCPAATAILHGPTSFDAILDCLLTVLAVGLLSWNAQEFTRSARPVPRLHRAFAVATAVLAATGYLVHYHLPYTIAVGDTLLFARPACFAATVMAGLARAYRRSDALERRQIRWVVLGSYISLTGAVLATLVGLESGEMLWPVLKAKADVIARVVWALSYLSSAGGLLISVVAYRWLDVDRLISAAASYTIVGLAVLGAALAGLPRLAHAAAPVLGLDPATAQWLLTMALVGAAIPVHLFLRPLIDRRLFAERHRRTLGFERLLDEIGRCASVEELMRLPVEHIDALLEPESIALYRREGAVFTPLLVRGRAPPPCFEADSLLVRALERRGRPLSSDAVELDAFDRAALETLGVALLVPTRGREGVVAFTCLGPKRSGDIYTPEEIAQLAAVANRCSEMGLRLAATPAARDALRTDAVEGSPSQADEPLPQVFRFEGEFWTIASFGKQIRLRDMRGLHYLATLLREPGREFQAIDLVSLTTRRPFAASVEDPSLPRVRGLGDAGEPLDARARAAYRARLRELEDERVDAERRADLGWLDRVRGEWEALVAELSAAAPGRRAASHTERARVAVTKAIKAALEKISLSHPELGAHLSVTIRRGSLCSYVPDPRSATDWET